MGAHKRALSKKLRMLRILWELDILSGSLSLARGESVSPFSLRSGPFLMLSKKRMAAGVYSLRLHYVGKFRRLLSFRICQLSSNKGTTACDA